MRKLCILGFTISFFCILLNQNYAQTGSIHLDGINDFVKMDGVISSLIGKSNFSIEITTKPESIQPQDYAVFFSANSNTAQLHRFLVRLSGIDESELGVVVLNIPANGQFYKIVGITPVLDGNCHLITWTYSNGTNKLYVDGILQGSLSQNIAFQNSDRFSLGQEYDEPFEVVSQNLKGQFDEFRVWGKTLTETEINSNKGVELFGDEAGLLDYFKFNQGNPGGNNSGLIVAENEMSSTRKGTLVGFSLSGSTSNWILQNCIEEVIVEEPQNNALHLDGENDFVNISAIIPSLVGQNQFSIEMKFKPEENQVDYPVLFSANSNEGLLHRFVVRLSGPTDNIPNVVVLNIPDNGQFYTIVGTKNISARACHHVAWTYNNGENKLYVDGILQGTLTKSLNFIASDRFSIGQEFDEPFDVVSQNFKGEVDEFRVWNKELSLTEITDRINSELTGSESNLTDYFKFIDGIALGNNTGSSTVTNSISSLRNGELVDFGLSGNTSNYVPENCLITLGIEELFSNHQSNWYHLYPNPAKSLFTVKVNENNIFDVQIFDLNGKLVQSVSRNLFESKVDVSHLISGLYIVNIHGENFKYSTRLSIY